MLLIGDDAGVAEMSIAHLVSPEIELDQSPPIAWIADHAPPVPEFKKGGFLADSRTRIHCSSFGHHGLRVVARGRVDSAQCCSPILPTHP